MNDKSEKPSVWEKFKNKYRFSIYRDETYEEVLNVKLTRLNAIIVFGSAVLIFMAVIISIMSFTPARELIPGYPDQNTVRNMHLNFYRLDSLEAELKKRDIYFENIRLIIAGEAPPEYSYSSDSSIPVEPALTTKTPVEDSLLRDMIETSDQYSLSFIESKNLASTALFFPPVKGIVTNSFNRKLSHYGTDIVAASNEVVKATLAGTVTLASWTLETGYIIQIQHENNLISVYKHNAELLKHMGDHVKAGEPIAIIGNSGELTTGPHLHFELWYNGTPLDPEEYVTF